MTEVEGQTTSNGGAATATAPGETSEKEQFLSNGHPDKVVVETKPKQNGAAGAKSGPSSSKTVCFGRCGKKNCLIAVGAMAFLIVLVFFAGLVRYLVARSRLTGRATAEKSGEWDKLLKESGPLKAGWDKPGVYEFVSYTDSFDDYLSAMGTPGFVIPLVKATAERITVNNTGNASIMWRFKTDSTDKTWIFNLGKPFETVWGRNKGVMHQTCSYGKASHVIVCSEEERKRNWQMVSTYAFYEKGLIRTTDFLSANVVMSRYYERLVDQATINKRPESPKGDDYFDHSSETDGGPFSSTGDDDEDSDFDSFDDDFFSS